MGNIMFHCTTMLFKKKEIRSRAQRLNELPNIANRRYETMLVLRPDVFNEEKDRQLAKFEAFLMKNGAENIECLIKGKQKMSYPIQGHWDGIYVLFQFSGDGKIAKSVHKMLSNPDVESQGNVVRWILLRLQ